MLIMVNMMAVAVKQAWAIAGPARHMRAKTVIAKRFMHGPKATASTANLGMILIVIRGSPATGAIIIRRNAAGRNAPAIPRTRYPIACGGGSAMATTCPTAGAAHAFAHFIEADRYAAASGFILFGGCHPTYPFIAR
jgi:hypothetical protein